MKPRNPYTILFLLATLAHTAHTEPINLESYTDDFVVKTKQIIIPGFPGAFNGSIVRWQEKILLCFRVRNEKMVSTFDMGFVWLNKHFDPISTPSILEFRDENPACQTQKQDPRLIVLNDQLYILYSNFIKIGNIVTRRMFIAQVHIKENTFYIINPVCLHPFEGHSARWEKNWVPFVYHNKLLFAYSLIPHRIFQPSFASGECKTHSSSRSSISWKWGELRGGTPAIRDGDDYLGFFHSSIPLITTQSQGKLMAHYVMGAYKFSGTPPFEIKHISTQPIVPPKSYDPPYYVTWKPLRVIFPMGIIVGKTHLWVTYGKQDFEIWVTKINKKKLYMSLAACSRESESKENEKINPGYDIETLYHGYVGFDENS